MIDFDSWYDILNDLAISNGESVADVDAWREDYDAGKSPEDSFYDQYPEYRGSVT